MEKVTNMQLEEIIAYHVGVEKVLEGLSDFLCGEDHLFIGKKSLYQLIVNDAVEQWNNDLTDNDHIEDKYRRFVVAILSGATQAANFTVISKSKAQKKVPTWDFHGESLTSFVKEHAAPSSRMQIVAQYNEIKTYLSTDSLMWMISHHILDRVAMSNLGLPLPGTNEVYSLKQIESID